MKVIVPTSWEDVTVNQYQLINTLDRSKFTSDLRYTIALIDLLCNIDSTEISLENFNEIGQCLGFLKDEIKADKKESILIDKVRYNWIADFNSLSVGEMLSIEQIIDMEELSYNLSIDVVAAVLLRQKDEVFNSDLFHKRRELFGNLPITELKGMVNFFSNGGRHSILNTKACLITPKIRMSLKMRKSVLILYRVINGFQWLTNLQSRILQKVKQFMNRITLQPLTY
jgi:hypothetical protein